MAVIASLVVNIAADTSEIRRNVEGMTTTFNNVENTVKKVAQAIGIAFSARQIIAFGKDILTFASDMNTLASQTGIGVEQLQALNYAASGSGISIDQLAGAVSQLSKRLVGGDSAAVHAVERLGLSTYNLIHMSPDQAFLAIAEAVGKISNPMEQNAVAMELFGRTGAQMLPLMKDNISALTEEALHNGSVMSKEMIEKADDLDDAWARLWIRGKALIADVFLPLAAAAPDVAKSFAMISNPGGGQGGERLLTTAELLERIAKTAPQLGEVGMAMAKAVPPEDVLQRIYAQSDALMKEAKAAEGAGEKLAEMYKREMATNTERVEATERLEKNMLDVRRDLVDQFWKHQEEIAVATSKRILDNTVDDFGRMNAEIQSALALSAQAVTPPSVGENMMKGLGASILAAFQGGGNVFKSIAGTVGSNLTQQLFGGKDFAAGLTKHFGSALGGMFSSLLPGIGALAGPLLSKIASLFAGIGGPSAAEKAGRSASDSFTQQLEGSLDWMQKIEVHQLIAAGNSEKFAIQLVAIRDSFLKAGHSADEVNDVINRLWAAEKQGGNAAQVVIDEIITKMHDEMPKAFQDAGDAGVLTFKSIEDAAMQAGAAAVASANAAFNAWSTTYRYMNAGGSNVDPTMQALSPENYASYADWLRAFLQFNPGDEGRAKAAHDSNSFAMGSGGMRDFGSGTVAILHGREEVRTEAQARADNSLVREVRELIRILPKELHRAARDGALFGSA